MTVIDLDESRWLSFVSSCTEALPFHHPAWSRLIADCYGFERFGVVVTDESGAVVAGMPLAQVTNRRRKRRWVSLPFTDHCPPLSRSNEALAKLLKETSELKTEAGATRIDVHAALGGPQTHAKLAGVSHTLALNGSPESVFSRFAEATRRNTRQSQARGVRVVRAASREELTETFYRLHLRTRIRLGVPVQPRRFFDLLWERILEPGLGFLLLAYSDNTPIAGAVFLSWSETTVYKYGASETAYLNLRPNNLLMWKAIEWACTNGCTRFDFGRTDADNEGLRAFKSGWGATETPLVYTVVGGRTQRFGAGQAMTKLAGGVIRHSPPWVCRALGELLYGYAA
jgi:CelD/BcsL family acetyltransferase involved in cellulose biosynthesis